MPITRLNQFFMRLYRIRSPLTPLKKGGTRALKVPLFKGSHCDLGVSPSRASGVDLGGSKLRYKREKQ